MFCIHDKKGVKQRVIFDLNWRSLMFKVEQNGMNRLDIHLSGSLDTEEI